MSCIPMNATDIINHTNTLGSEEFRLLEIQISQGRWTEFYKHPASLYWPVFAPISSKRKGDIWEDMYRKACPSLQTRSDQWHDATLVESIVQEQNLQGQKIEIKYTAITRPDSQEEVDARGYALELGQRAKVISTDDNTLKFGNGGSFQQVHPQNANYGLFSAVHANGAIHYWVPYHLISRTAGKNNIEPGKVPLSSQHDGGIVEGQLNRTARFHEVFFLDFTIGTPFLTDLSKYDLSKYENIVY